ncbi:MAG: nuclear transport factor 2 family protein, partial [Mycobacterium sp.]
MLSLEEISDRLEIQQLLVDYSTAIDQRRFDDLDKVFIPDAYIDYRALGG